MEFGLPHIRNRNGTTPEFLYRVFFRLFWCLKLQAYAAVLSVCVGAWPLCDRCQCMANWYGQRCTEAHDDCSSASSIELCVHGTCHNVPRSQPGQVDLHTSRRFRRHSFYMYCSDAHSASHNCFRRLNESGPPTSRILQPTGAPTSSGLRPSEIPIEAQLQWLNSGLACMAQQHVLWLGPPLQRFEPNLAKICHAQHEYKIVEFGCQNGR